MKLLIRQELYLAALLEHIEEPFIQKTFRGLVNSIDSNSIPIKQVLKISDKYATAGSPLTRTFDFVATPFEKLKSGKRDYEYSLSFDELSLKKALFPKTGIHKVNSTEIWNKFAQEFAAIQEKDRLHIKAFSLLEKYAIAIPNPSSHHPEISWFDYAKTKAGIAISIFDVLNTREQDNFEFNDEDELLAIIRADVSGIQSFISNITSNHASKNLKGRSFYVQLLSDTVLRLILKEFNLFEGNVLYASGGNFFIIAPNSKEVIDAFDYSNPDSFVNNISQSIFEQHKTSISVVFGCQTVSHPKILKGEIDVAIRELFENQINLKKQQKFHNLIESNYNLFFNENYGDKGGLKTLDSITGEELGEQDVLNAKVFALQDGSAYPVLINQADVNSQALRRITAKQIYIGGHLKEATHIAISYESLNLAHELSMRFEICPLETFSSKIYFYLVTPNNQSKILNHPKVQTIQAINQFDFSPTVDSFLLYGGNDAPKDKDGTAIPFHDLAKNSENEDTEGEFKRLSVLKMDVDGLGTIFKENIPFPSNNERRPYLSFSYYAALSRHLDWFFKGYLNTIWQEHEGLHQKTQIIYSGGDDLFIVGRWDLIIEFAEIITKAFSEYTCALNRPFEESVTLSGGISIVTSKFPIMKAADFADAAEKKAKKHEIKSGKSALLKNAVSFLGTALNWETEFPIVKALKTELMDLLDDGSPQKKGGLPKSIISKIQIHYQMMLEFEEQSRRGCKSNPKWIWVSAYDFSRLSDRLKNKSKEYVKKLRKALKESNKEFFQQQLDNATKSTASLDRIKNAIFTNKYTTEKGQTLEIKSKYHFLNLLNVAARWAQLTLRSQSKTRKIH